MDSMTDILSDDVPTHNPPVLRRTRCSSAGGGSIQLWLSSSYRWTSSSSSPPSPTPSFPSSSIPSSKVSQEFNEWYQALGINGQFEMENGDPQNWVRNKPLAILQLDVADRKVLKIAGEPLLTTHVDDCHGMYHTYVWIVERKSMCVVLLPVFQS